MITKKRELQINKPQNQLKPDEGITQCRSKFFRRSKFVIRDTSLHKPSHTMNLPRHSFNDGFKVPEEKPRLSRPVEPQRIQHKSLYDRPFHLLKQYLHRKEKHTFMPLFDTNPERVQDISKAYTTLNQFRVRKAKKVIADNGDETRLPQYRPVNKINKIDEDFVSFNTSKNLYQMTTKQLEESIKWKKEFLDMLNERIKDRKVVVR